MRACAGWCGAFVPPEKSSYYCARAHNLASFADVNRCELQTPFKEEEGLCMRAQLGK